MTASSGLRIEGFTEVEMGSVHGAFHLFLLKVSRLECCSQIGFLASQMAFHLAYVNGWCLS